MSDAPCQSDQRANTTVVRLQDRGRVTTEDLVAVEEPLEIQLTTTTPERARTLAITMRTPGHDRDLAVGFLLTEGVIRGVGDIRSVDPAGPPPHNSVVLTLDPDVEVDWARLERHVYTASSCGVCGKTSIESVLDVRRRLRIDTRGGTVTSAMLYGLQDRALEHQGLFRDTGGCHAAALFDHQGRLFAVREDVGRHNALDKLVGALATADRLPLADTVLLLSGRASFELVQKAASAGVPVVCAVGAPSTLAIELADAVGITLVGFLRRGRANVYTRPERICSTEEEP